MAAYSQFVGVSVKVQYRLGDIVLSASGKVVADSGRSIFLEEHVEQRGKRNYFRWEIPYPYINRIEAAEATTQSVDAESPAEVPDRVAPKAAAAAATIGDAISGATSVLPFPQRRRTA